MRDSGLDVSFTLRQSAIDEKRASYVNAVDNGFNVGTYDELIPSADLVLNLTPDKQHSHVVKEIEPLMKQGACLAYSHGFNIVEEGQVIRPDITVIMVAPKCPGTEVREEYKRGSVCPRLLQCILKMTPTAMVWRSLKHMPREQAAIEQASKVVICSRGEIRPDGRTNHSLRNAADRLAAMFRQDDRKGCRCWIRCKTDSIWLGDSHRGIKARGHHQYDGPSFKPGKIRAFELAETLKDLMRPLYEKHMDDIMTGAFSSGMMDDWADDDAKLLGWRQETGETAFETTDANEQADISEQAYFDLGILMVAMVKAGLNSRLRR